MPSIKYILTILCLLVVAALQAQQAVTPAGGNATGTGGSMSYTIGQVDFTMGISTGGSMAQGVQHPYSNATTTAPIIGPSHLCEGATAIYTDSTPGGIWTSGNTVVATIGSTTGLLNSISGGVAIISYYVPGSGSIAVFTNITVDTLPNTGIITGPSSVCVSAQITLSDVPANGTWTSSSSALAIGSNTGIVTGISAGTSIVSYIATNACGYDTATTSITVNPLPNAGSITGASTLCEGANISLSNLISGGIWSSSNNGIATVGSTGLVHGVLGGNVVISYTATNGCGTASALHPVIVNPLVPDAGIITGPNSVVTSTTITLTNAVTSGVWSASNGNATISPTGVVTGVTAGTVTISYTVTTVCGTNVATKIITVNPPLGPITGTLAICMGTTTTLSNSVSGGSWLTSNFSVASVSGTGVVTGVSAGTATITYLLSTNYVIATVTVYPLPPAITGAGVVCTSANITLSNTSTGGIWSSSNTSVATIGSASGIATGVASGTTVISYTIGCSVTTTITVNPAPNAGTITGTGTTCVGGTRTLSNAVSGGTWSSSNTAVATVNSTGIVTGISAGTATISYTVTNGCGAAYASTVVTINAPSAITGVTSVCIGTTSTLGNATSGGIWGSSNTSIATIGTTTGIVSGVSPGTANITYMLSGGCYSTTQLTVNAALTGSISGAANVCVGSATTFTHPTSGGTWSSSNVAKATVNVTTGVVTGVSAGSANITYTVGGCFKTKSITINAGGGGTITGTTTICEGSTSNLSYPATGSSWTSSNPAVATIGLTSGLVTAISAGTTDITYTGTTGCGSATVVTVLSLPAPISGTFTICQGATTTLNSIGTPGGTWASSNTSKATVGSLSGVVTGQNGGTTTITYTWTNSCKRMAGMTVNPLPVAGAIVGAGIVHVGSNTTLSPSSVGGTWASGSPAIATVTPGSSSTCILTGVSAGSVVISYTNTNGCGSATVTRIFSIVFPRPGVQEAGAGGSLFNVYPNPTSGEVTVDAPVSGLFSMYTIDGRFVQQYEIKEQTTNITLSNKLAAGIYMCRFNGDDGSTVMVRLVVER